MADVIIAAICVAIVIIHALWSGPVGPNDAFDR